MTAYTATFADGTTKTLKNSRRVYTHAWKLVVKGYNGPENVIVQMGFANGANRAAWAATAAARGFKTRPTWAKRDTSWHPAESTEIEIKEVA